METAIAPPVPPQWTPSSSSTRRSAGSAIAWTAVAEPPVAHSTEGDYEDGDTRALRAQCAAHKQFVDDIELMAYNAGYGAIDTPDPVPGNTWIPSAWSLLQQYRVAYPQDFGEGY